MDFIKRRNKLELESLFILFFSVTAFSSLFTNNNGSLGNFLSYCLESLFGITKYIIPVVYIVYSIALLKTRNIKYKYKLILTVLTIIVMQGILDIADKNSGIIGRIVGNILSMFLGNKISLLLLLLLLLLTISRLVNKPIWLMKDFILYEALGVEDNKKESKNINDFIIASNSNEVKKEDGFGYRLPSLKFSDVINDKNFENSGKLSVPIGVNQSKTIIYEDISEMPHLLAAGSTGGGKSVFINTLICSLLLKNNPDELKLVLIDMKRIELSPYKNIKHLLYPVATEVGDALKILGFLVKEMEDRYITLENTSCRDINIYNSKNNYKMSRIIIVIDEYADLAMQGKEIENLVLRLAQKSRACGIHLVLSTQRPTTDIITGTIKANLPARISFYLPTATDSRTILDVKGTEMLLDKGDMLLITSSRRTPERLQGIFTDNKAIDKITNLLKNEQQENDIPADENFKKELDNFYNKSFFDAPLPNIQKKSGIVFEDDLTEEVLLKAIETGHISSSWIRNNFGTGTSRANKIIKEIKSIEGILGEAEAQNKPRKVLIDLEQWNNIKRR